MKKAATPESSALPVLTTLCLGAARPGQVGVVSLKTQGRQVLERELVSVSPASEADRDFLEALYQRVFLRTAPTAAEKLETARRVAPLKPADVVECHGIGIAKRQGRYHVYSLEVSGDKVVRCDLPEEDAAPGKPPGFEEWIYAWESLDRLVEKTLVFQDRRSA
jgi:hypothetical protein